MKNKMATPPFFISFLTIAFVILVWHFWYLEPEERKEQREWLKNIARKFTYDPKKMR